MISSTGLPSVETTLRVTPNARTFDEYLLYRRHLFAYEQALKLAGSGGVVADIACGMGYGLEQISVGRDKVIAIDLAATPLRHLVTLPALCKVQADAARLPFGDGSFDVVLAFQLIEHVPEDVARTILCEIRRVLRPAGRGFVTTPNSRWRLLPGQRPWNPYHVVEYSPKGILQLCASAGVPSKNIRGVMGCNGAQEAELARVRQDPLQVYLGRPGAKLRWALDRVMRRPYKTVEHFQKTTHDSTEWFYFTDRLEDALDFWVEIVPASRS